MHVYLVAWFFKKPKKLETALAKGGCERLR
jgi:hypothetical protein